LNHSEHPNPQFQVINLTGRLTRDPELRELPSGTSVCNLRLAVDGLTAGREAGYIDVATFGKPGEAAGRVLSKGWLVSVSGRLEHRTWKAEDDSGRHAYQIIGDVQFLTGPRGETDHAENPIPAPAAAKTRRPGRDATSVPPTIRAPRTRPHHDHTTDPFTEPALDHRAAA